MLRVSSVRPDQVQPGHVSCHLASTDSGQVVLEVAKRMTNDHLTQPAAYDVQQSQVLIHKSNVSYSNNKNYYYC